MNTSLANIYKSCIEPVFITLPGGGDRFFITSEQVSRFLIFDAECFQICSYNCRLFAYNRLTIIPGLLY